MRILFRAPQLKYGLDNVVEISPKAAYMLRNQLQTTADTWKDMCLATIAFGRVPNKALIGKFEGNIEIPGSEYIRREARRYSPSIGSLRKGQFLPANQGLYARRKARGTARVRGTTIGPSTQPLGVWTGGLWNGVQSGTFRSSVGSRKGVEISAEIDSPNYFETVHDGYEPRNIAARPFVDIVWDAYVKQDAWIRINRAIKGMMDIWTSPSTHKLHMDTGDSIEPRDIMF